jgi:hypothetical protein
MPEIRRALGHKSIQSTAVYTEISDAIASKAVAAAVAGHSWLLSKRLKVFA